MQLFNELGCYESEAWEIKFKIEFELLFSNYGYGKDYVITCWSWYQWSYYDVWMLKRSCHNQAQCHSIFLIYVHEIGQCNYNAVYVILLVLCTRKYLVP